MSRFVFDTNVIVSALLFAESVPGQVFSQATHAGTLLISTNIVIELTDVLSRKKFDRYISRIDRERFLAALVRESELVEITETILECRDPDDNQILELAVCGQATLVITGDDDLLTLNPFRGIPIRSPADVLEGRAF